LATLLGSPLGSPSVKRLKSVKMSGQVKRQSDRLFVHRSKMIREQITHRRNSWRQCWAQRRGEAIASSTTGMVVHLGCFCLGRLALAGFRVSSGRDHGDRARVSGGDRKDDGDSGELHSGSGVIVEGRVVL